MFLRNNATAGFFKADNIVKQVSLLPRELRYARWSYITELVVGNCVGTSQCFGKWIFPWVSEWSEVVNEYNSKLTSAATYIAHFYDIKLMICDVSIV